MASSDNERGFPAVEGKVLAALLQLPEIQEALTCEDDEAQAKIFKCLRTRSLIKKCPQPKKFARIFEGRVLIATWGLQGSGKTTVCKLLREAVGGQWINQDDVAEKNPDLRPREAFVIEVRRALRKKSTQERFVFVDKTNVLRQQRLDILKEMMRRQWFKKGHRAVLLEYVHKEDPIGHGPKDSTFGRRYSPAHISCCARRIEKRGEAHHTLRASTPNLTKVLNRAAQSCERPSPGEQNLWQKTMTLNVTSGPIDACMEILKDLHDSGSIECPAESYRSKLEKAWTSLQRAEESWRLRTEKENSKEKELPSCVSCGSRVDVLADEDDDDAHMYCRKCWKQWDREREQEQYRQDTQRHERKVPRPLYWQLRLPDISKRISALPGNLITVTEPHVTLLYIGGRNDEQAAQRLSMPVDSFKALRDALQDLEGQTMKVRVTKIAIETGKLAVAVVEFVDPIPCAQELPHVTLATADNVPASYASTLLAKIKNETYDAEQVAVVAMPGGGRVFEGSISLRCTGS